MALGEHLGPIFLGSVRRDLATDGWCRVAGAVSAQRVADWRAAAEAGAPCPVPSIENVLLQLGPLSDIDWWEETQGLPSGPAFILDLDDRGSAEGGLLLRSEGDDRLSGWRPEASALIAYADGILSHSAVAPAARPRLAITGRLI